MKFVSATLAALTLSTAAFAGPQCTEEPKSKWMSEEAMKQQIADAGYSIGKFKVTTGNCYEIYGKDKTGAKVEIYYSPIDGSVIKEKRG